MKSEIEKLRAENDELEKKSADEWQKMDEAKDAFAKYSIELETKVTELQAENAELKGVLNLKNDEYVQQVGTWRIIHRLEEREKSFEGLLTAATAQLEKLATALDQYSAGDLTPVATEALASYEQFKKDTK